MNIMGAYYRLIGEFSIIIAGGGVGVKFGGEHVIFWRI